jgi:HEAT repeat protein
MGALGAIGPPANKAVPALLKNLTDPRAPDADAGSIQRQVAIWALGCMGPAAEQAVPALSSELESSDDVEIRRTAAEALGKIGLPTDAAVAALKKAVRDSDEQVRASAVVALKKLGR